MWSMRIAVAVAAAVLSLLGGISSAASTGGLEIVFVHESVCAACPADTGPKSLAMADPDGSTPRPLTTVVPRDAEGLTAAPITDTAPAVSPEMDRVAFVGYATCANTPGCAAAGTYPPHLIVEDLRDGHIDDLAASLPPQVQWGSVDSWSSDGRWLRVWGLDYSGCFPAVGPYGAQPYPVSGGPAYPAPGSQAPAHCASGLWDVAVDGSLIRQTVYTDLPSLPAAFTPEGRRFTFALGASLYAVPVHDDVPDLTRHATRIAHVRRAGARITEVAWARDGQLALLVIYPRDADDAGAVYVAAPHKPPTMVQPEPFGAAATLAWSPDGGSLLTSGTPFPRFTNDRLFGTKLTEPTFRHLIRFDREASGDWKPRVLRIGGQNYLPRWIRR
jgi:hypothetical protein